MKQSAKKLKGKSKKPTSQPGRGKSKELKQKSPRIINSRHKSAIHGFLEKHSRVNFSEVDRKFPFDISRSLRTHDKRVIEPLSEDSVSLATSLLDPLNVYRFRLAGYTTLSQSTGTTNSFIATDPSASGWNAPEWSNLTALFSEFRLVSFSCTVIRNYTTIGAPVYSLAVASSLGSAANPGSYASIVNFPDCKFLQFTDSSRGKDGWSGATLTMHASDLGWSILSSPTATPYAGAPGCIMFYNSGGGVTGSDFYQVMISGIYDFRCRS